MYGVPKDLNLSMFIGSALIQIAIGEFQVQFHFHPEGYVGVEGDWEVRDRDGQVVDRSMDNAYRLEYRLHRLLGQDVVAWEVDAPRSFSLQFSNGDVLQVFDIPGYDSFSIQPGDIFV